MSEKRILIITSQFTGHGHKSISDAISEQLSRYPDAVVRVIDGFTLIGKAGVSASKLYSAIANNASDLWKIGYSLSSLENGRGIEDIFTALTYDRFMRCLKQFQPGLIVSVHAMFTRSLLNILEYHKIDIPFVVIQADIINIHPAWCDPRALLTFCPTSEAYDCSVNLHKMPEDRLELCGFPIRKRFLDAAREQPQHESYDASRPLRCLLMSGGEGSGNLSKFASTLLDYVNCELTILCGRNKRLKAIIDEQLKPKYGDRITAHGFLENVQDYMKGADLVVSRGSPNTMFEAITLGIPLLITGSLPGQEADNPAFVVSHNLGIVCSNPSLMPTFIKALMANGGKRLSTIRIAQHEYRDLDGTKNLAARLYDIARPSEGHDARPLKRFPITLIRTRYEQPKPTE